MRLGLRGLAMGLGLTLAAWSAVMAAPPMGLHSRPDELGGTAAMSSAEFAAQAKTGITRVPFMKTPPKLDGRMDPGEWEDSAACYGSWQCYVHSWAPFIAIEEKQPVWYLAYDSDYLYVAHRSPVFPRSSWLLMRGKYHDVMNHKDYGLLRDDNVQFSLIPTVGEASFFKWMCNPINTWIDLYKGNAPMSEIDYRFQSGFETSGGFDEDWWTTEWRIPLETLAYGDYAGDKPKHRIELPLRDGTTWQVGTARSIGGTADASKLFSGRGSTWAVASDQRLVFDSQGVAAQVTSFGKLQEDAVNVNIVLKNHGERSETVRVGFFVENDQELIVANEDEEFVELLPGEVKRIRIKRDKIGITPQGDAVWVDIRTLSKKFVYRDILMKFHSMDGWPMYRENFVDGMKYSRPPRQPFSYDYAHYPSVNKLRAVVDTDVFGPTDDVKTAVEARVTLLAVATGEEVATLTIPLEKPLTHAMAQTFGGRRGEGVMSFAKLPKGEYKTVCLLYDGDRKILADIETKTFFQDSYPWEGNRQGLEDVVWHPYTPIEVASDGKSLKTLMHEIALDGSGMPAQIAIKGRNPNYGPQLRAPLRFEATADGSRSVFAATAELKRTRDWKSEQEFEAAGAAGPVTIRGRAQYDCDGTLTYDVWYRSGKEAIETLEVVLDLAGPVDLLGYRGTGYHIRGEEVTQKDGPVIWNSRDDALPRELFYGNFIPCLQIGNGDRCLYWLCDTDRGMKLLAEKPAMQVERTAQGEYTLRVFLVNEPGTVEEERHVRFAVLTQPDRPKPAGYRRFIWTDQGASSGGGGGTLGDGTSAYSIHFEHEEDYEKLAALYKGKPDVRPYTDPHQFGFNMPSVRSYCYVGEWAGSQLVTPKPRFVIPGTRHKVTGRPIETIFEQSTFGSRWVPSKVDCAVYWRAKHIRQGFLHGYYWDDGVNGQTETDPVVGNAYFLPKHKSHPAGHLQYAFAYLLPRQFYKRLARINAEAGLEPSSNDNGGMPVVVNTSYFRDNLMWESNYVTHQQPHMKRYSRAQSRYFTEVYSGRPGYYRCNLRYGTGEPGVEKPGGNPMHDRSLLGSCLLHDVGSLTVSHANIYTWRNVTNALGEFGYLDEDAETVEYIPYWRSQSYYEYGLGITDADDEFASDEETGLRERLEQVCCSIYRNRKTGKALLVLGNYNDEPVSQNLVIKPPLLDGKPAKKCTDVEVGQDIYLMEDPKEGKRAVANVFDPVYIEPWQFRMLVVE